MSEYIHNDIPDWNTASEALCEDEGRKSMPIVVLAYEKKGKNLSHS